MSFSDQLQKALRVLGYSGGQSRSGIASALEAITGKDNLITPEEYLAASKLEGDFPTTAQIAERAGVPEGPSAEIPLDAFLPPAVRIANQLMRGGEDILPRVNVSARDAAGFVGDVVTDPLTYVGGVVGRAGSAASNAGSKLPEVAAGAAKIIENSAPLKLDSKFLPWFHGGQLERLTGGKYPLEIGSRAELAKLLSTLGPEFRTVSHEFTGAQLFDEIPAMNPWDAVLTRFEKEGVKKEQLPNARFLFGDATSEFMPENFHASYAPPPAHEVTIGDKLPKSAQRPDLAPWASSAHEAEHAKNFILASERAKKSVVPELFFRKPFSRENIFAYFTSGGYRSRKQLLDTVYTYLAESANAGDPKTVAWARKNMDRLSRAKSVEDSHNIAADIIRYGFNPLSPQPGLVDFVQTSGHFLPPIHTESDIPMYYMAKEAVSNGLDAGVWQRLYNVQPDPNYVIPHTPMVQVPEGLPLPGGAPAAKSVNVGPWAGIAANMMPGGAAPTPALPEMPMPMPASVPSPSASRTPKPARSPWPSASPSKRSTPIDPIDQRMRERDQIEREMRGPKKSFNELLREREAIRRQVRGPSSEDELETEYVESPVQPSGAPVYMGDAVPDPTADSVSDDGMENYSATESDEEGDPNEQIRQFDEYVETLIGYGFPKDFATARAAEMFGFNPSERFKQSIQPTVVDPSLFDRIADVYQRMQQSGSF